jgi:hypothetical protein
MPDFDFDAFNHDEVLENEVDGESVVASIDGTPVASQASAQTVTNTVIVATVSTEEVDKW